MGVDAPSIAVEFGGVLEEKRDLTSSDALEEKAKEMKSKRNYDLALELINKALETKPNDPNKIYLKASILEDYGELEDAGLLYQQLVEIQPDNSLFAYHNAR
jgi:tetratricopeptide (TPR) repeat protein